MAGAFAFSKASAYLLRVVKWCFAKMLLYIYIYLVLVLVLSAKYLLRVSALLSAEASTYLLRIFFLGWLLACSYFYFGWCFRFQQSIWLSIAC